MNNLSKESQFLFSKNLDHSFLNENYGTNLQLASKIFAVFLSTIEQDIEKLKLAIDQSDFSEVYQISHKVKNNFLYVGLTKLSQLLRELEIKSREKSPEIENISGQFFQLFETDLGFVQDEMKKLKAFLANKI